jgi:hypothetical protein
MLDKVQLNVFIMPETSVYTFFKQIITIYKVYHLPSLFHGIINSTSGESHIS